jgi:Phage tail protein
MSTAVPGQLSTLYLSFYNEQSGSLDDPSAVQLDITYGSQVGLVPDVAGPFSYAGATLPAPNTIWRIAVGQYAFMWQVPTTGVLPGVYVANWTCTYGPNADEFLVTENFPLLAGGPFVPVPAGDLGYWTGSIDYPAQGVSIPLGGVDETGTSWLLEQVQGWDGPDTSGQVIQRSADHGGWAAAQYYAPRLLTLTVLASSPNQAARDMARAKLQQAVPVNDLATFTYGEPVSKQVQVRRTGKLTETYPTLTDVEFQVALVAPDPRKYATSLSQQVTTMGLSSGAGVPVPLVLPLAFPDGTTGGSTTVTNGGTFETRPTVTVTGPIVGPSVVNVTSGMAVSYSALSLGPSDHLVIDFDARTAQLNESFRPADPYSAWWTLQPGPNVLQLQGTTPGGASVQVSWSDAWI